MTAANDNDDDCALGVQDENGNYNGLIGYVQRGQADTALMTVTIDLPGEPIKKFSPVYGDSVNVIGTAVEKVTQGRVAPDALDSFKDFDTMTWTLLALTTIFVILLFLASRKLLQLKIRTMDIVWHCLMCLVDQQELSLFGQFMPMLFASYCVWIFLFHQFFTSLISTNQVVVSKLDTIDSLKQLAMTKTQPIFIESDPIIGHFAQARPGTDFHRVWKMTSDDGIKRGDHLFKAVSEAATGIQKLILQLAIQKSAGIIADKNIVDNLFGFVCMTMSHREVEKIEPHVSEQKFLKTLAAQPLSVNVSNDVQERFFDSMYRVVEGGYSDYWWKELFYRILTEGIGVDKVCLRKLKAKQKSELSTPPSMSMLNVRHFWKLLNGSLVSATFSLLIEIVVNVSLKRRKKRHLKRRRRVMFVKNNRTGRMAINWIRK